LAQTAITSALYGKTFGLKVTSLSYYIEALLYLAMAGELMDNGADVPANEPIPVITTHDYDYQTPNTNTKGIHIY
jgi:hypothetical protein